MAVTRCSWANGHPLLTAYHDDEWGIPEHDDAKLFELLMLEGAQAGLSWLTVLKKRERYREVTHGFDLAFCAGLTARDEARLLADPGIIRNRLKVASLRQNARAFQAIQRVWGSFDRWLWTPLDGQPVKSQFRSLSELPAKTELSDRLSKGLKRAGFTFVGSTICYAFMQAAGLVDDHTVDCFRY